MELGITTKKEKAKEKTEELWRKSSFWGYSFRNLQAALVRIGLEIRSGSEIEPLELYSD